jgi:hypothetical protein
MNSFQQPIDAENSSGTWHLKRTAIVSAASPASTTAQTVTASAPVGSTAISGYFLYQSSSTGTSEYMDIRDTAGTTVYMQGQNAMSTSDRITGFFIVPIDSSLQFSYKCNTVNIGTISIFQTGYYL